MMRLIDADALEKNYRNQFESVYKYARDTVAPSDFYIERNTAYEKAFMKMEMEAFFEYLQSRPAVDAEPVRHGEWVISESPAHLSTIRCSECGTMYQRRWKAYCNYCPNCGAKMDAGVSE